MFHVIDDEPDVRKLIETIVSWAGYPVLAFESGDAYLKFFHSPEYQPPVAIITDFMMPGINGYELAMAVRKCQPFQKIVLVSGTIDINDFSYAKAPLCYGLPKPFKPAKLTELLEALMACEQKCEAGCNCYQSKLCEFGIDFSCPFHP